MGRLVTFVLSAAVLLAIGYWYVTRSPGGGSGTVQEQRVLGNVREKAREIEVGAQERANQLLEATR